MTNLEHIANLSAHGARIITERGTVELTEAFYEEAVDSCIRGGANAICYDLLLPGIEEPMALAVHRDGHVDSGSAQSVTACLDR